MTKLIILRGPFGSGKTYVYDRVKKKLIKKGIECVLIDTDVLSFGFTINSEKGMGEMMIKNCTAIVHNFLRIGLDVLVVGSLSNAESVKRIKKIGLKNKARCKIIRIDIPYKMAKERVLKRTKWGLNERRYNIASKFDWSKYDWRKNIEVYLRQNIDDLVIDYKENIVDIIVDEMRNNDIEKINTFKNNI